MSRSSGRQMLIGCAYCASLIGFFLGFSLYGDILKNRFDLTQTQMDQIGELPNIVGLFGLWIGLLAKRLGNRLPFVLGGTFSVIWVVYLYMLAARHVSLPWQPAWTVFCAVSCMIRLGVLLVQSVAFALPLQHFTTRRAEVGAILSCYVPSSSAVAAQVQALLPGSGINILFFWVVWILASSCGAAAAMKTSSGQAPLCVNGGSIIRPLLRVLLLASFVSIVGSFLEIFCWDRTDMQSRVTDCSVALLFMAPVLFALPFKCWGKLTDVRATSRSVQPASQLCVWKMLCTADCWLWFATYTFVATGAHVILYNAAQIVDSAGFQSSFKGSALVMYSAGSNVGSLSSFVASDRMVSRGCARPRLGAIMAAVMSVAFSFLALASVLDLPGLLFVGFLCAGYSMGTMGSLGGVIVCELFGAKHLVENNTWYGGAHEVVACLFVAGSGLVYDAHADAEHHCVGSNCFLATYLTMVLCNALGCLAGTLLSYRLQGLYSLANVADRSAQKLNIHDDMDRTIAVVTEPSSD